MMQNKLMATWIIAAFLFTMMSVFSLFDTQVSQAVQSEELSSTEYVIQSNDMLPDGIKG